MSVEQRVTAAVCNRCGSEAVACNAEYYSTGGDMEHVDFTHACDACGYVESETHQGCYGYDNSYSCSMRHRDSHWGISNLWRVMVEHDQNHSHVVKADLTEQAAENIKRQYQRDTGPRYWIERM